MDSQLRIAMDARFLVHPVLRGMDRYLVGLAGELVRQGVEVTLLHRACEPLNPAHLEGLGCVTCGLPDRGAVWWEQVSVPLALWRGGYDVYHAPAERGVPLVAPCPVALTIHSLTDRSYAELIRRGMLTGRVADYLGEFSSPRGRSWRTLYADLQFARPDHIFTPSEFCRAEVVRFLDLPPSRVTATPLAVHHQFLAAPKTSGDRAAILSRLGITAPYLLYVGGYEQHKNVDGLLEMFARVLPSRPALSLVLVGSKGVPERLVTHARRLGLRPGVDLVFLVNVGAELPDLYDGAELFVTLSWRETFCLPLLEAMTRGIPVVAGAWGAAPEVVGAAGVLVDPREPVAAAKAVTDILAFSAGERSNACEIVRRRAARFSWSETAAHTKQVYKRLVG